MVNLLTPYNSHLLVYTYVSKRSSRLYVVHMHNDLLELPRNTYVSKRSNKLHVVHIHNNLLELPRNIEVSVIKRLLLGTLNLS